uniref:DNA (cytosine-5-)-methyltransferase n=1 Tax=Oryza nivara TaxID=4536 RepID=A0A0E0J5Z3_ORYNI
MRIASSSGILMDANGKANGSAPSALVAYFLGMGFSREMVFRAIKEIGNDNNNTFPHLLQLLPFLSGDTDSEQILELLLTYQAIGSDPSVGNSSHSACDPQILDEEDEEDVNWDEDDTVDNFDRATYSDGSGDEMSEKDEKIKSLVSMGFPEDEAMRAITRCGLDASVDLLVESIYAPASAGNVYFTNLSDYEDTEFSSFGGRKKTKLIDGTKKKRERYRSRPQWNQVPFDGSHEEPMPLPNPMVGFSLPNDGLRSVHRNLPDHALGPPFFYYENVALAPKGVWTTISRFLYDIYPEFVDSKYFCAAARKRGYIHNLPIKNRSPVLPIPPKTISEAFPSTKMWWPSWDPRRQFNCLQTCVASVKHTERIRCALGRFGDALPPAVQKSVLEECRKWNLVWAWNLYEDSGLSRNIRGVWTTISRFLYDIYPEFVDSKYFCAAARKRGYIHNLPIENRSPILPIPPKTISEAFPSTKMWWPSWDPRRQFNCLQTYVASAKHTERIRCALGRFGDALPPAVQKSVLEECRKWNLVWVGKKKVATLEPDEMEFLLGYPRNHTRGEARYRALGNSFQVDTVAYHLSVLRDIFPNGMNVLSLFSGIGGAEIALHRLGIRMKTVVSVEISEANMALLRSWWDQTQTGTLIEIADVQNLTAERIELFIRRFGGFDLVIGGSPCNNLAGSNRYDRDGLEGKHSTLFYHYYRILDSVKTIMASMKVVSPCLQGPSDETILLLDTEN